MNSLCVLKGWAIRNYGDYSYANCGCADALVTEADMTNAV
jgi:hypothetical protein